MSKTIVIKLTESSLRSGPFNITDQFGNVIAIGVSRNELIAGIAYSVADDVTLITIESYIHSIKQCMFMDTLEKSCII
jgi:hypothetical protein